jgi:preprotein translocase SecE subunit
MKNPISGIASELKSVTWPTRRETLSLTLFTVVVCAIIALVILGLDVVFLNIRDTILSL